MNFLPSNTCKEDILHEQNPEIRADKEDARAIRLHCHYQYKLT